MSHARTRIDHKVVAAHADDLAHIIPSLGVTDTAVLWAAIRKHWRVEELRQAIARFQRDGTAEAFRAVLHADSMPVSYGKWSDLDRVLSVLRDLIKELGRFPTQTELNDRGYAGLADAVYEKHGGMKKMRELLGVKGNRVEYGEWTDFAKVKPIFLRLVRELGHFPTRDDIRKQGYGGMLGAVRKYHGGLGGIRKRLGIPLEGTPDGFWKDFANVEPVLWKLAEKVGHFPTTQDFEDHGYAGLLGAIQNHHGGLLGVRERLKVPLDRTPNGQWKEIASVEVALRDITRELGHFPSLEELSARGLDGLVRGIYTYHGGLGAVRTRMQIVTETVPYGHWKDWVNVEAVLHKLTQKLGRFPTKTDFKQQGYGSVLTAIARHHGGMAGVYRRMEVPSVRVPKGHWVHLVNVAPYVHELVKKIGAFPVGRDFADYGYERVLAAIESHHGGLSRVRAQLGYGTSNGSTPAPQD